MIMIMIMIMILPPRCSPLWFILLIWTGCMWLVCFKPALSLEKDRWRQAFGEGTRTYAGCHFVQHPRLALCSSIYVTQHHFWFMSISFDVRCVICVKLILCLQSLKWRYSQQTTVDLFPFLSSAKKLMASQVVQSVSFSDVTFVVFSQGISSF